MPYLYYLHGVFSRELAACRGEKFLGGGRSEACCKHVWGREGSNLEVWVQACGWSHLAVEGLNGIRSDNMGL